MLSLLLNSRYYLTILPTYGERPTSATVVLAVKDKDAGGTLIDDEGDCDNSLDDNDESYMRMTLNRM